MGTKIFLQTITTTWLVLSLLYGGTAYYAGGTHAMLVTVTLVSGATLAVGVIGVVIEREATR